MDSSDCCSICLENMVESETTLTQCSHRFHTTCLQRWNKNSCPNCRRSLTAESTQSTDQREQREQREINIQPQRLSYNLPEYFNYNHDNIINYNRLSDSYNTLSNRTHHNTMIQPIYPEYIFVNRTNLSIMRSDRT